MTVPVIPFVSYHRITLVGRHSQNPSDQTVTDYTIPILKDYDPKREVYMAEARRKTTIEERKEIVEYCLKHNRDYKETSSIYAVSYSQVYSWVK